MHALVGGTSSLTLRQLYRSWDLGYSRMQVFRGSREQIAYTLKRVGESPDAAEHNAFKLPHAFKA